MQMLNSEHSAAPSSGRVRVTDWVLRLRLGLYSPPVSYLAQREAGGLVLPEERAHEPLSP